MSINVTSVFQIKELIEHAKFHKQQHGDNFFMFLSKHYGNLKTDHDKNNKEEKEEHKKLPFQNNSIMVVFVDNLISSKISFSKNFLFKETAKPNFYYLGFNTSGFNTGIFQPPKLV